MGAGLCCFVRDTITTRAGVVFKPKSDLYTRNRYKLKFVEVALVIFPRFTYNFQNLITNNLHSIQY